MTTQGQKFKGKIAWITGGNSGIGLATALAYAKEGAQVIVTGRDQKTLDAAQKTLGDGHLAMKADASSIADTERVVAEIKRRYARLDILFVNAGIAQFAPFAETPESLFDATFAVNVKGAYFSIQKALPLFGPAGGAVVVNSSVLAHQGSDTTSVYAASKAALLSLTRVLAKELAPRKIRVNSVSPGPITTPIYDRLGLDTAKKDGMVKYMNSKVPLGRFGESEEVAKVVLFLTSDESSYVTGAELLVDGGLLIT